MARSTASAVPPPMPCPRRRVLILGPVQDRPDAFDGVAGATILVAPFSALDEALLARVRPDVIHAVLAADGCDPIAVARRLSDLGYAGTVRGFGLPSQRGGALAGHLAQVVPGIDFEAVDRPA